MVLIRWCYDDVIESVNLYCYLQSQDSGSRPTKLVSVITQVKQDGGREEPRPQVVAERPTSDGIMYGNFNERRIEYEEVLLSERTDSQFSQSESYLSET